MQTRRAGSRFQRLVFFVFLALIVGSIAIFAVQQCFNAIRQLYGPDVERIEELLAAALSCSIGAVCVFALVLGVDLWRLGSRVRTTLQCQPYVAQAVSSRP